MIVIILRSLASIQPYSADKVFKKEHDCLGY